MKHYIITRYNLHWKPDINMCVKQKDDKTILNSNDWLEQRLELFKKYYIPSILAQTNKNFKIFLGVSPHTPNDHLDFLSNISNIEICNSFDGSDGRDFKRMLFENNEPVITTRIDNDDAISKDFVKIIQSTAEANIKLKSPLLIDVLGYQYLVEKNKFRLQHYKSTFNSPFSSVVSYPKEYKWCHEIEHTLLWKEIPNYIHIPERLYLQVLHPTNASNSERGIPENELVDVTGFEHIFKK